MNRLVKEKEMYLTCFEQNAERVEEESNKTHMDICVVKTKMKILESNYETLNGSYMKIIEMMLQDETYGDEELVKTNKEKYKVMERFNIISITLDLKLSKDNFEAKSNDSNRTKIRLPKIDIYKFGGDLKEWLPFWSNFKRIHENNDIDTEDKFQYLLQAIIPKSRAGQLIESYPPTANNYEKALDSLKSRFGREDLLIEVYVRELLKLIINNLNIKSKLSTLYDKLSTQLRALETLGISSEKYAAILYPLVESCLPEEVLRVWQRSEKFSTIITLQLRLDYLMEFLMKEVENEERIALATTGFDLIKIKKVSEQTQQAIPTASGLLVQNKNKFICIFCNEGHFNDTCPKAYEILLYERKRIAASKGCCLNCLRFGHFARRCRSSIKCDKCNGRHASLMCPENEETIKNVEEKNNVEVKKIESQTTKNETLSNQTFSHVFLQTLAVNLIGKHNKTRRARALIDTGSQRSYILKKTAREMNFESVNEEDVIHGLFGGVNSEPVSHKIFQVNIKSLDNSYLYNFEALDQNVICGTISPVKDGIWLEELKSLGISLSDVNIDSEIEILIGADIIGKLLTGDRKVLDCGLVALETKLGWTLMGKIITNEYSMSSLTVTSLFSQNSNLSNLWSLDVIGISDPVAEKDRKEIEEAVKNHFLETVTIDKNGRYEVSLPWKENHTHLHDNYYLAEKRLETLNTRLKKNGFYAAYDEVFDDWLDEEIIELVPKEEENKECHYLSHHGVIKLSSATTKVRPVFNASAKTNASPSLNHCLEKGVNLIELIPSMLIKFRIKKLGVIADIKKAFLQISLNINDRDFLRFLWYDKNGKLKKYRHTRVVFGVNASPFLLGAVINYHLKKMQNDKKYSENNIKTLLESFYVDNCITSFDSEEQVQEFILEATKVMAEAKFDLRLWEYTDVESGDNDLASVLGLKWDKRDDVLKLSLENLKDENIKCTKKNILSAANKIFDPIGFAAPYLLLPKIMLQKLCLLKLGWNAEAPEEISKQFKEWFKEIKELNNLKIPRWVTQEVSPNEENISLHLFCDASQLAYSALVFLRIQSSRENVVHVQLVQAKARVAPAKKISICRLELLAATIGSRLLNNIIKVLKDKFVFSVYCWTDSTTALSWINKGDIWKPFVKNRVDEIRALTSEFSWKFVPGDINPADLPSRGCSVKHLIKEKWWEGPQWLKKSYSDWPVQKFEVNEAMINEEKQKKIINLLVIQEDYSWLYRKFSKYDKILNMVAWMNRFIYNCTNLKNRRSGPLSVEEIEFSETIVIKLIQKETFNTLEFKQFGSLTLFEDNMGLLRIRTKISERQDCKNFLYPYLLPSKHPIVRMLIFDSHVKNCHSGVQTMLSILRENFWIINGRKTIRSVISKCIKCRRFESRKCVEQTVELPNDRVRDGKVFEICGTDMAGPLFLRDKSKVWICIFTCAIYRAIHLELVSSLSTDSFIQALRRFIARRGRPLIIYSDNGTNYLGTSNALNSICWEDVKRFGTVERIKWKFNPPTAAWWGGWWERLIKILKGILRRTLGKAAVTMEELATLICECEAVINSRPITYVSEDCSDKRCLTPSMFLHEINETGVPDLNKVEANDIRKRIRYRLKLREDLKKRFRNEYLGQLALKRTKCYDNDIKVGDIVLIGSDDAKRLEWPLAKIIEAIKGKDGKTRVVRLKTQNNILLRPIQRIFPLEIFDSEGKRHVNLNEVGDVPKTLETDIKNKTLETIKDSKEKRPVEEAVSRTRSGREIKMPDRYGYN